MRRAGPDVLIGRVWKGLDHPRTVPALIVLGFLLRLAAGFSRLSVEPLAGYSFYLRIASTWLDGGGLCWEPGVWCARRLPLFPLFLAPFVWTDWVGPGVTIVHSAMGAATAWLGFAIARQLFGHRAGVMTAAMVALSPYAVLHDAMLQDTVLVNGLVALAVLLLLKLRRVPARIHAFGAGMALALAVLTSARMALLAPLAMAWSMFASGDSGATRIRHTALLALPVFILVGGWMLRNWTIVGAPVLTTENGLSLWVANNEWTFANFPERSIDLSVLDSYRHLSPVQREALDAAAGSDLARDRLQRSWALQTMMADPLWVAANMAAKLWVSASAQLTPARQAAVQLAYAIWFLPIHALAALGLWQSRGAWRDHVPLYLSLASFAVVNAVFWAHTSHKSVIDIFLFVYAAGVVSGTAASPRFAAMGSSPER